MHAFTMKKHSGITLLELMVVVAIIGIIASIAFPSYQNQIETSRRADCQATMTAAANAMERYKTGAGQGSYADADAGTGVFSATCPFDGSENYYSLSLSVLTASSYTILAEPMGPMTGTGRLAVTHTGQRCWFEDADNSDGVCTPF